MKTTKMFLRALAGQGGSVDRDNPWPGLLPFSEADQEFFHGRRRETDALARLVSRARVSVLFGLSGLGKSSLLQAGLFPRLRDENVLPVYLRLDFAAERPDLVAQVLDAIAWQAEAAGAEAPASKDGDTLWEYFHRRDADFWSARNRPIVPLLVFDQFEEIFTLGRADGRRAAASDALIEELADLAEGRPPASLKAHLDEHPGEAAAYEFGRHPYKILLALREDFLPDLESLGPRLGPGLLNRLRLRPMDGTAALEVVSEPSHLIPPDVAAKVVRFVSKAEAPDVPLADLRIDPALLSVVCRELNNQRRKQGKERITAELLEGSQTEILSDFYERSLGDLGQEVRTFIEEELLVEGFRDSVAVEKAVNAPGITREVIDQLVERRLVRIDPRDGVERLELTHDLLTGVIAASRDRRRRLESAERESAERERELLELQERERKALEEAARREKEARLRLRAILAVLAVVLAAALFAGWQATALRKAKTELEASNRELHELREELQAATALAEETIEEQKATIQWYEEARMSQAEVEKQLRALLEAREQERATIQTRLESAEEASRTAEDNVVMSRGAVQDRIAAYSEAKGKLPMDVQEKLKPTRQLVMPAMPERHKAGDLWAERTLGIRFRHSPAGTFLMGSPAGEAGRRDDESQRRIQQVQSFWMAESEVTQAQWQKLIGRNPAQNSGCGDCPVEQVSWLEAIAFANRLSAQNGLQECYGLRGQEVLFRGLQCGGFRLPTEAEWEYAARAGSEEPRYGDLPEIAWYSSNTRRATRPVKQKKPNAWGLYDMLGNVREWVGDLYETSPSSGVRDPSRTDRNRDRVIRGCSWTSRASACRAAARERGDPEDRSRDLGFRLARTADQPGGQR